MTIWEALESDPVPCENTKCAHGDLYVERPICGFSQPALVAILLHEAQIWQTWRMQNMQVLATLAGVGAAPKSFKR